MSIKLLVLRLVALLGLAVSSASLLDYLSPTPVFCGFESGCEAVVQSAYGSIAGIPLAAFGIAGFALFLAVTLFPAHPVSKALGPLALLAGVGGMALLLVQALVLEQFCQLCLIADACALCLALVHLINPRTDTDAAGKPRRWLWAGLAAVAVAAPLGWGWLAPSPAVPEPVRAHWVPDRINIILVTDFDCVTCRQTHPALTEVLKEYAGQVHFVQLALPMPQNANARPAARTYLCAQAQGKGESMAEALFAADDLTAPGCEKLAARLGLDLTRFRTCVADPATEASLEQAAWVRTAGVKGLPVIWVQDQRLVGAQTAQSLRAALQRAVTRARKAS
ncbi:MAG: thioredoxin domain-containing protein [Gemmataceae bacterium]|nr:thioredoxin domain-containing protein [Gemmataceae bacterium]